MTEAAKPIVQADGLTKKYASGDGQITALDGVSFTICQGEYVSIQGPSGCGKSTLLAVIGLLEAPDGGSYRLAGTDVSRLGFDQRAKVRNEHIGLIFQAFNLIEGMTILENVCLPLRYHASVRKAERQQKGLGCLERVGLGSRANSYPSQLSGGQQQRVAIARALVTRPALLLADEPTGNLDSKNAHDVMGLLSELNAEGATILLVTHDPAFASAAPRSLSLLDGVLQGQA